MPINGLPLGMKTIGNGQELCYSTEKWSVQNLLSGALQWLAWSKTGPAVHHLTSLGMYGASLNKFSDSEIHFQSVDLSGTR